MNMLLCVAVTALRHTSDSGALAFLLIALISEKKSFSNAPFHLSYRHFPVSWGDFFAICSKKEMHSL